MSQTASARTVTEADGALPNGVTVFDDEYPGVANLDPDLLRALRDAAADAADEGIPFYVNSGWRSAEYQNQLRREAVDEYGSDEDAARWVATADTSAHVSGNAVDIGPFDATVWLSEHGAAYGLCQIYGNESWHYELRPEAIDRGCPPMYADPAHDPRMQQVRVALSADIGRICELLAVLGYPTRSDDVERVLSEPGGTVLVAEIGGAVVGVLVGSARWQLHHGSTTGSIDALVVDATYRSAGLGASLVHAFVEILDREGVRRVEVHSNASRTRAHRFYERLGFQPTSVYFVRDVTG